jgi:hypothetical protein
VSDVPAAFTIAIGRADDSSKSPTLSYTAKVLYINSATAERLCP